MRRKNLLKTSLAVALAVMTLAQPVSAANWVHNNVGWWWQENNGSYPANKWKQINGQWYWFDSNGYMATGWRYIGGKWYWLEASGAMATGWRYINGKWYYMDSSGAMAANRWIGNYYVEADGAMATNKWIGNYYVNGSGLWTQTRTPAQWIHSGNRWCYRHSDGSYTRNGWETINGKDYYFDSDGWMLTGWKNVNGKWYYLESSGAKATNKWIGNYYVEANGVMATSKWIGNYYVDGSGLWVETKGQHNFDNGVVTKAATCGKNGVKTFTCKTCGETKTESIPATEGHKYDNGVVTKEPTCANEGVRTFTCTECGETKTEVIPATGKHKYESVVTKEPTCLTEGEKLYYCTTCSDSYTEELPMLAHSWVHHEAEGHYETVVIQEAKKEPIYESVTICNGCGKEFRGPNQVDDAIEHDILECGDGYHTEETLIGYKDIPAVTEERWVEDKPAYNKCSVCGFEK